MYNITEKKNSWGAEEKQLPVTNDELKNPSINQVKTLQCPCHVIMYLL